MSSVALNRENFLLHKIHSLTGIVPVGYYMAQHLVLNSYSLAGPSSFDGVIAFFDSLPKYVLLVMEVCFIWLPLAFHAVYGMFIVGRAEPNLVGTRYSWAQNRMYTFQRWSGIFLFFALILHFCTTTMVKYLHDDSEPVKFAAWHTKLASPPYLWLVFYVLLVFFASYHLGNGIWSFCIRWGITLSDRAQAAVQKVSLLAFVGLTLIGWAALAGFLIPHGGTSSDSEQPGQSAQSGKVSASLIPPHAVAIR
jgi:succinate dehydrogenase / fumarate reductase cytochrome b subunit